jgi:hypothetical protein
MKFLLLCGLFLIVKTSTGQSHTDSLLQQLKSIIENRDVYVQEKLSRIVHLKEAAAKENKGDRYELYLKIYEEYKSFIYDSAFHYAVKIQRISYALHDPVKVASSKIKLGFILVSSGLFNEALDTLRTIHSSQLPDTLRAHYYYLMARTFYDLSDFNRDDYYSALYSARGHAFIDSAIALTPSKSPAWFLMTGLKRVRQYNMADARIAFETMIGNFRLSDSDFAVAASTLSFIYFYSDQPVKSKEMLIRAAIADIHSATKETLATLNLADMLYKQGDADNAYQFVKIAMEDANFYGARHRKVQVAAVFPIIEGQQLRLIESRRRTLLLYSSVITILLILLIVLAFIIYKQFKNLKEAKKVITEANNILVDTNHQLVDANKIKEEYIWYYFNTTADYINKLDSLKKSMDVKLMTKKIEDLRFTVDSINIKREREDLYHNFDMVFLKLFPDFVAMFNSFFREEDQVTLKDGQLLNTELRIFALIRMGIHDNEKIAKILDYSVTTIYTYKTRIRSKSLLPNEEFDRRIMSIRAI